ncbi:Putative tyrosinase copper-binding domain, di-copper centre-containing domain superfamily, tyosinase [Septoria linicola]|uniref:tyrosinase n=1 Tax=Septoria linicola TaxID=215465 RepID=A0A9Q9EPD6_9PEZI|nr:Putative tyrosinase copper-binding domain, di-copper centre-containing domain superfamily, tyosinase [Septoria linicola]
MSANQLKSGDLVVRMASISETQTLQQHSDEWARRVGEEASVRVPTYGVIVHSIRTHSIDMDQFTENRDEILHENRPFIPRAEIKYIGWQIRPHRNPVQDNNEMWLLCSGAPIPGLSIEEGARRTQEVRSVPPVPPQGRKYNPLHHAPLPKNADENVRKYGNPTVLQRFHDNASLGIIGVGPQQRNLSERVANILGAYRRFSPVCNNKYSIDGLSNKEFNAKTSTQQRDILSKRTARSETWGSLEDIHNTVHGIVGNGGHMGQIEASAFDPIFWLHHCNIDRLFALWQGLREDPQNKDTWVTDQNASWTFMRQDLEKPDSDSTPLYPFKYIDPRDRSLKWYTSAQTHNIEDFNYTYEELSGLQSLSLAARRSKLIPIIGALYPQPGDDVSASFANVETAGARMLPQAKMIQTFAQEPIVATASQALEVVAALPEPQVLLQESLQPEKPFLRDLADKDHKFLDWIVNVKGEKHALDGKYAVYLFLGPVQEDDVELWPISPHFVGLFAPFGQSATTGCGKCQQAQREQVEVTGQIPLTVALTERYIAQLIPDLSVNTIVPYLQKNLHWRVAVDHQALDDRSQVPGLTVFVVSNEVTATQPTDELPIFADEVVIHAQATTNLDGTGRGNGTGLAVGEEGTERTTSS